MTVAVSMDEDEDEAEDGAACRHTLDATMHLRTKKRHKQTLKDGEGKKEGWQERGGGRIEGWHERGG